MSTGEAFVSKTVRPGGMQEKLGGLVTSFERNAFVFDGGIRVIENSGIVNPMIKQLGISVELLESTVSVGIGSDVVRISSKESLADYQALLERQKLMVMVHYRKMSLSF